MKIPTFRCPHCNNDLGFAMDAYLYGSPLRQCNKCKKTYVDNRYHEIAIEGIRQEDINPTEADKQSHKKSGSKAIWIGVGMIALFVIILFTGWIVFPLPIFGVISIISGISAKKGDSKKELEKTRKALEIERQQSILRMQNPQYVEQLRAMGYIRSSNMGQSAPSIAQKSTCSNCGAELDDTDRFCPKCGNPK